MEVRQHLMLLGTYNEWMNDKTYTSAATLPASTLTAPTGAFFGSILGTLNHILVGDILWLQRFARYPKFANALQPVAELPVPALNAMLCDNLEDLAQRRRWLDNIISNWLERVTEEDLDHTLSYQNSKGVTSGKRLGSLILHLFNHQTHHRGQVTTLLSQAGVDVGVTDLVALITEQG